jgi:hypothetical protein
MAKRRSEQKERYWGEVLQRQARSGLSIAAFCRSEGLSEATFHWWKRALRRQQAKAPRGRRNAEVVRNGSEASPRFVPVRITEAHRPGAIEVVWPNGLSARVPSGCDVAEVQGVLEVVDALARQDEGRPSC